MENIKERIEKWVDGREADIIADISRLVAIRSVAGEPGEGMPFGEGPAAALREAMEICRERGLIVRNHEGYVLTADINGCEAALDILAHLDVVGEGEGWETEPYRAVVKDGCLYGRGADDDKGPAVAAVYAMECARELCRESGIAMRRNARLILGTDEESGSRDIAYYYRRNKPAPNTFSPDASFPVYNVEKGLYRPSFSFRLDPAGEAALPRVLSLSGGERLNVVPAEAAAVVAGLDLGAVEALCRPAAERLGVGLRLKETDAGTEIAVEGRSAHASTPELGLNALTALLELLAALPLAECGSARALRRLGALFPHGDWRGSAAGIAMEDGISGPLTLAFTLLEMDSGRIAGRFDARVPVCANDENCKRVVEARLVEAGFEVSGEMSPPHHTPADSPFVKTLLRAYEAYTGNRGECLSMGGGTYVHGIEGGVAFGAAMPGFQANPHGANERLRVKDLLAACKIFAQVIIDLCA